MILQDQKPGKLPGKHAQRVGVLLGKVPRSEGGAPFWEIRTHGETHLQVKLLFFQYRAWLILGDSGTIINSMLNVKIV